MLSQQDIHQIKIILQEGLATQEKHFDQKMTDQEKSLKEIIKQEFKSIHQEVQQTLKKEIKTLIHDIGDLLDERILPMIGDHEKRITNLEEKTSLLS